MIKWAGIFAIALWLITMAVGLTMMWDRSWMESDPPAEMLTMGAHVFAVGIGVILGALQLAPKIRNSLTLTQRVTWVLSALLAMVTIVQLL